MNEAAENSVFKRVLDTFFDGRRDELTLSLLGKTQQAFILHTPQRLLDNTPESPAHE